MISDSLQLRKQAAAALGDKLLTSLQAPVQHTRRRGAGDEELAAAFRTAAAEMWLYSLADYHIMTLQSGFGRWVADLNHLSPFMSFCLHQRFADVNACSRQTVAILVGNLSTKIQ